MLWFGAGCSLKPSYGHGSMFLESVTDSWSYAGIKGVSAMLALGQQPAYNIRDRKRRVPHVAFAVNCCSSGICHPALEPKIMDLNLYKLN